jgi:hypothetical protein
MLQNNFTRLQQIIADNVMAAETEGSALKMQFTIKYDREQGLSM